MKWNQQDEQLNIKHRIRRHRSVWRTRRRKHIRRTIWTVVGLVILVILVLCGYVYNNDKDAAQNSYYPTKRNYKRNPQRQLHQKGALSILFLGIDSNQLNENHNAKTDTMIINTVSPKTNATTMTSIPRNAKVKLNGTNVAMDSLYLHGGIPAVTSGVQQMFKIPVDYYILSDTQGLARTTGQIGGVKITPGQTFVNNGIRFQQGRVMNMGQKQILAYLKMHGSGNQADYQRQMRNRQVLLALFDKVTHHPLNPNVANSLSSDIHTDLSFSDLTKLALHYRNAVQNKRALHLQGKPSGNFETLSPAQKQRVANAIRQNLGY